MTTTDGPTDPTTLVHAQRQAEDALLAVQEARLAAARQAQDAAEAEVQSATTRLLAARLAAESAAAELDSTRTLFRRPRTLQEPMLNLPADVLVETFKIWFALDKDAEVDDKRLPMAFTAASVCKVWRNAALGCSLLWSHVVLDLDNTSDIHHYLRIMLSRNRTAALDTEISNIGEFVTDSRFADTVIPVPSLVQLLERSWKLSLHGQLSNISYEKSIFPYLQAPMPKLIELVLDIPSPTSLPASGTRLVMLAPNLQRLIIQSFTLELIHPPAMPCIQYFETDQHVSTDQLQLMASSWTSLRELRLLGRAATRGHVRPAIFPCLIALTVERSASRWLAATTKAHVPCLSKLSIVNSASATTALTLLVAGSPWKTLTSLTVSYGWPLALVGLLQYLPNLVECAFCDGADGITTFLTHWHTDFLMVPPRLAVIRSTNCEYTMDAVQALVDFLAARYSQSVQNGHEASSIKELYIHQSGPTSFDGVFPKWILQRLEMLVKVVKIDTDRVMEVL